MIDKLMRVSLHNRLLVLFLVLLLVGLGALAIRNMPLDAFPDVTSIQVEVVVNAPGLSPPEIERSVTHPVETAMKGLPGLETMRSVTKYGLAVVTGPSSVVTPSGSFSATEDRRSKTNCRAK